MGDGGSKMATLKKSRVLRIIPILLVGVLFSPLARAKITYVDDGGPSNSSEIEIALNEEHLQSAEVAHVVTVPGTACIFFAGQDQAILEADYPPDPVGLGDHANFHNDTALAANSMPPSIEVYSGGKLSISAVGIWNHYPEISVGTGPDGSDFYDDTHDEYVYLGGISRVIAPINTLVGVFLTDDPPDPGRMPTSLTLGDDMTTPKLQQAFAIGSSLEYVTVPEGATRLFFGHNDGYEWNNNVGSVEVTYEGGIPADVVGRTIYVDHDANGANDGSSWADACLCLRDALAVAQDGDEIRVAQGIHKPDQRGVIAARGGFQVRSSGDRTETFQLVNSVVVKGDYAGLGEPDPDARDVRLYETILSGDLNGDDGPGFANRVENSYHVVTGRGTNETAVLDGFTVTGGNASDMYGGYGGGMYNHLCRATVTNCIFSGNLATRGGGMANTGDVGILSSPTLTNCVFSGNSARWGGGICYWGYAGGILTNCAFSGNTAEDGGAIFITKSSEATLKNCTLTANWASAGTAGAINCSGNCSATLVNTILWGNSPNEIDLLDSSIAVTYSDVQGAGRPWPGTGNIDADPLFADADGADDLIGTSDDDLRLLAGSPCIDAGDNSAVPPEVVTDHSGNPRIVNGIVDMGAYEFGLPPVSEFHYAGQISTSEDDGYAFKDTAQNLDTDFLRIGSSSFAKPPYYMSGMVFRNVDVPRGAEIISARLKICAYTEQLTGNVFGRIEAEAADSAATFGSSHHIASLPKTSASVHWDLSEPWSADTWYESPDIAEVIQEVINRDGWSANNSLAIVYSTRSEGGYRSFSSYDRGSDYAPKLEITYTP